MKNIFYKRFLVYLFAVTLIVLIVSGLLACSIAVRQYQRSVDLQKNFMLKFTKAVNVKYTEKNVIVSPAAVHTALGLAYLGARNGTASALAEFLGFQSETRNKKEVAQSYALSFAALPWRKGHKFQMANRIFVDQKYELSQEFNELATNYLQSNAKKVNFDEPILTADEINTWIASELKHEIQNIISVDVIVATDNPFVLVNAITFEAYWQHRFADNQTLKKDFHLSRDLKVPVDMMYTEQYFKYADLVEWDAVALALPFLNSDIFMFIILPNSIDGLQMLETKLNVADFNSFSKLSGSLKVHKIKLSLPKFSFEFSSSLKALLKEMGLTSVFDNTDFSGLFANNHTLPLSDVIHKTSITVNEIGFDATEAFNVAPSEHRKNLRLNAEDSAYEFNVDHPFLFLIRDSDTIYFAGHVTNL